MFPDSLNIWNVGFLCVRKVCMCLYAVSEHVEMEQIAEQLIILAAHLAVWILWF